MSREQRDALRESFLRAYARNGKVAENARVFSIRLCTAQGWVNRYIRDGRKFKNEHVPDELVNSDLKIAIGQREPAQDRDELQAQMQEHMVANQRNPEKMQRLFHKESVKYASHMEN